MASKVKTLMVTVDPSLCMGCRSCEFACAVAHSVGKDVETILKTGEKPGHRINVESAGGLAVPVHCNHCDDPACVLACPTGAMRRKAPGAPVLVDEAKCIGCKMCVQACPFGVITLDANGKGVLKCDLCIRRLAQGLEPACVESCPTKALAIRRAEEANRDKRRAAAERLAAAAAAGKETS